MKKYDFTKPPQNYEARVDAMGGEFLRAVVDESIRFLDSQGPNLGAAEVSTIFTLAFLWGQENPLKKKKKAPAES